MFLLNIIIEIITQYQIYDNLHIILVSFIILFCVLSLNFI